MMPTPEKISRQCCEPPPGVCSKGNLRSRLSVGMAVMITLGMALFATLRLIEIQLRRP